MRMASSDQNFAPQSEGNAEMLELTKLIEKQRGFIGHSI
jgi:hypothetical protein